MWTPWIPSPAHPTAWAPPARGARRALIDLLLRVSALLVRTAVRLQRAPLLAAVQPQPAAPKRPVLQAWPAAASASDLPADTTASAPGAASALPASTEPPAAAREFHAEAGAPEGALYVDGQLIGHLQGVPRL
jgi:hypothetical protein